MSSGAILTLGFGTFGGVGLLPTLGYGTSATPPTPVVVVPTSGGFEIGRLGPRRRTPEDIRQARVRFGVIPDRIIEDVALRQAGDLRLDSQQRIEELRGELKLQGIGLESRHIEALNSRRQVLIDAEIGLRIRTMVESDDIAILMLIAAAAVS